ncbi:MAG: hypothetical protein VBE63_24790 [Lamprobacter sp.]|nr:hypothetical protein [Lamprobacter sp.]MEA3643131.1 hypothetical protein [Lamprobacter sp.]
MPEPDPHRRDQQRDGEEQPGQDHRQAKFDHHHPVDDAAGEDRQQGETQRQPGEADQRQWAVETLYRKPLEQI